MYIDLYIYIYSHIDFTCVCAGWASASVSESGRRRLQQLPPHWARIRPLIGCCSVLQCVAVWCRSMCVSRTYKLAVLSSNASFDSNAIAQLARHSYVCYDSFIYTTWRTNTVMSSNTSSDSKCRVLPGVAVCYSVLQCVLWFQLLYVAVFALILRVALNTYMLGVCDVGALVSHSSMWHDICMYVNMYACIYIVYIHVNIYKYVHM